MLLTLDDWKKVLMRIPQSLKGKPVVGLDLGKGRAFSSGSRCSIWPSGRVEAVAVCGGIPSLAEREKQDQVAPGTYSRLVSDGRLYVDEGRAGRTSWACSLSAVKRVEPIEQLLVISFHLDDLTGH